jgi:hypothetical protein
MDFVQLTESQVTVSLKVCTSIVDFQHFFLLLFVFSPTSNFWFAYYLAFFYSLPTPKQKGELTRANSGGCPNHTSWHLSPQYILKLKEQITVCFFFFIWSCCRFFELHINLSSNRIFKRMLVILKIVSFYFSYRCVPFSDLLLISRPLSR